MSEQLTPPEWVRELGDVHRMLARGVLLIVQPHKSGNGYTWQVTRAGRFVGPSMMHPDAEGLTLNVAKARAIDMARNIVDDDGDFWETVRDALKAEMKEAS